MWPLPAASSRLVIAAAILSLAFGVCYNDEGRSTPMLAPF